MPWSIGPAEIAGIVVGSVLGNRAASKVKKIMRKHVDDDIARILVIPLVSAITAGLVHGASAWVVKMAVNILGMDPVGGGVTQVSTPTTTLGHIVYEFFNELEKEIRPAIGKAA